LFIFFYKLSITTSTGVTKSTEAATSTVGVSITCGLFMAISFNSLSDLPKVL